MQTIAVLITCFNRKEKTLKCLECLYAQLPIDGYEVDTYLTNDGCTDGTPEAVRERFPAVQIIDGDGNLYWNRGMYTAWKKAAETREYDFYLWLNDDTLLEADSISVLIRSSIKLKKMCIIIGSTSSLDSSNIITYGGRHKDESSPISPDSTTEKECTMINGNIVLVPKYVYQKIGTNDPYYRHNSGDNEYGLRAIKNGLKCYIAPGIIGKCNSNDSIAKWCNPEIPLKQRCKHLYSPLGQNPCECFVFEKKNIGFFTAIYHYFTKHIRMLFPYLFK